MVVKFDREDARRSQSKNVMVFPGFALVLALTFVVLNCTVLSSSSIATTTSPKNASVIGREAANCINMLNEFDASFDLRRQIRQNRSTEVGAQRLYTGKSINNLFEPEANCFSDERFGGTTRYDSFGDGPKFVCGVDYMISKLQEPTKEECLVYNVGSDNSIMFETSVKTILPKCQIYTFDPTLDPNIPYIGYNYSEFHPFGFGKDGEEFVIEHKRLEGGGAKIVLMSLETVVKKLGHENQTIDIFKIDCEGCEFTAVVDALNAIAEGRLSIDQIQVEVHFFRGRRFADSKMLFDAADRAGMRVFHKEGNHWGCNGWKCVEYAFVSQHFLRKANAFSACPGVDLYKI